MKILRPLKEIKILKLPPLNIYSGKVATESTEQRDTYITKWYNDVNINTAVYKFGKYKIPYLFDSSNAPTEITKVNATTSTKITSLCKEFDGILVDVLYYPNLRLDWGVISIICSKYYIIQTKNYGNIMVAIIYGTSMSSGSSMLRSEYAQMKLTDSTYMSIKEILELLKLADKSTDQLKEIKIGFANIDDELRNIDNEAIPNKEIAQKQKIALVNFFKSCRSAKLTIKPNNQTLKLFMIHFGVDISYSDATSTGVSYKFKYPGSVELSTLREMFTVLLNDPNLKVKLVKLQAGGSSTWIPNTFFSIRIHSKENAAKYIPELLRTA